MLRQSRIDAGLTQEQLAQRSKVATRTISDLERGVANSPHGDTVLRLARGLQLEGPARERLELAARRPAQPDEPAGSGAAAMRTLPRDISSFTGRGPELGRLAATAGPDGTTGIYTIGGMAGVGKTTFAVHAATRLAGWFPDGQVFLPLHGHTPGRRPVGPADALASLLLTAGVDARQIPADVDERAALWRARLAGRRLLLVLDDAVSSDQVRPLLPGSGASLVLITSRGRLTALEDSHVISLDTLRPAEAATLLVRLADRPDLDPGDPAVAEIAAMCGYLPLAAAITASQLGNHPAWTAADLAADLTAARDRLKLMTAENLSVAVAFELSHQDLAPDQQRLFRRLGLHPGTDIDAWAAAALDDAPLDDTRRRLNALYDQHFLTEPSRGRYRFHDLIRQYSRRLAATEPPADRDAAIRRLFGHYLQTARAAGRRLARRTPAWGPATAGGPPAHSPDLSTRERAVSWMADERLNLQAVAEYAQGRGDLVYVGAIPAAMHGFLRSQGHWDQALALHRAAVVAAGDQGDRLAEAGALTDLADIQYLTGDYPAAAGALSRALELTGDLGDRLAEASALTEFGVLQQATGEYAGATASLTRALELSRDRGDLLGEANARNNLGVVQFLTGNFPASAASQEQALELYRGLGDQLGEASALNGLGGVQQATGSYPAAVVSLTQALELYRGLGDRIGEAYAIGNLGAVQCITGDLGPAAASMTAALELYRDLGSRNGEADILSNLGSLQRMTGDYPAAAITLNQALGLYRDLGDQLGEAGALSELGVAQHLAGEYAAAAESLSQAVKVTHDIGDRNGEAEALNNLGELCLDSATPADAHARHAEALTIAVDIASPLEEARAREGIGRCQLRSGQLTAGAAMLGRALEIYRRLGSPNATRVAAALREHSP
ncbi:MAG: tetratricopeptide repeat protein [Trebonia sp.]